MRGCGTGAGRRAGSARATRGGQTPRAAPAPVTSRTIVAGDPQPHLAASISATTVAPSPGTSRRTPTRSSRATPALARSLWGCATQVSASVTTETGRSTQKIARQLTAWVRRPPITGPSARNTLARLARTQPTARPCSPGRTRQHDRQRRRHHRCGADALDGTRGDEHVAALGEAGRRGGEREHDHPGGLQSNRADAVGEPPAHGHERRQAQQVSVDHPVQIDRGRLSSRSMVGSATPIIVVSSRIIASGPGRRSEHPPLAVGARGRELRGAHHPDAKRRSPVLFDGAPDRSRTRTAGARAAVAGPLRDRAFAHLGGRYSLIAARQGARQPSDWRTDPTSSVSSWACVASIFLPLQIAPCEASRCAVAGCDSWWRSPRSWTRRRAAALVARLGRRRAGWRRLYGAVPAL